MPGPYEGSNDSKPMPTPQQLARDLNWVAYAVAILLVMIYLLSTALSR